MKSGELGKTYNDGEIIFHQGEFGNHMYVIQSGQVEILKETGQGLVHLATRGPGEFFGEMAVFEGEARMATVRALGEVRLLTIDKKNFLRRIQEDPSLAFGLVQAMSARIRSLSTQIAEIRLEGHHR